MPRDSGLVLSDYVRALEPLVEKLPTRRKAPKEVWVDPMSWDERFEQLLAYRREMDDFSPPFKSDHFPGLGQWLAKQLSHQYLGKLDKEKEARLAAIGVPWLEFRGRQRRHWWEQYEELRQFYKRFRHSRVPTMWEENLRLSRWVKDQRALFCARRLSFEQIHALEQLKFDWKITTWAWTRNFKELRNFKSRYGHMYVYRWKPAHAETVIAKWLKSPDGRAARRRFRRELQDAEKAAAEGKKEEQSKDDRRWLSDDYEDEDDEGDEENENESEDEGGDRDQDIVDYRGSWEELIPANETAEALRDPRFDEFHRLPYSHEEATGAAHQVDDLWELSSEQREKERALDEQLRQRELNRERARVRALQHWVTFQQKLHRRGQLKQVRADILREVGFDFGLQRQLKVNDENSSWWRHYSQLAAIRKDNPKLLHLRRDAPMLYRWLANARYRHSCGTLSSKQRAALEEAGLLETGKNSFPRILAQLQEFHREHGHFRVPAKAGPLGRWAAGQRYEKRHGRMLPERERALDDIGFDWGRPPKAAAAATRGAQKTKKKTTK